MTGSLQLYIDTKIDLLADGEYKKALREVLEDELNKLKNFLFYFWSMGFRTT